RSDAAELPARPAGDRGDLEQSGDCGPDGGPGVQGRRWRGGVRHVGPPRGSRRRDRGAVHDGPRCCGGGGRSPGRHRDASEARRPDAGRCVGRAGRERGGGRVIEFPDPLLAVLEILRAEEPGATYGTRPLDTFPDGSKPPLPYVLVAVDAASLSQRVLETVNVRVTVWA